MARKIERWIKEGKKKNDLKVNSKESRFLLQGLGLPWLASAGDMGLIPGLGRSHTPQSS